MILVLVIVFLFVTTLFAFYVSEKKQASGVFEGVYELLSVYEQSEMMKYSGKEFASNYEDYLVIEGDSVKEKYVIQKETEDSKIRIRYEFEIDK
jgi:hypothetical protein